MQRQTSMNHMAPSIPPIWSALNFLLMQFWSANVFPKYLHSATFWKDYVGSLSNDSALQSGGEAWAHTWLMCSTQLQPLLPWIFLTAYSTAELKNNSDKAAPCFSPFWIWNASVCTSYCLYTNYLKFMCNVRLYLCFYFSGSSTWSSGNFRSRS